MSDILLTTIQGLWVFSVENAPYMAGLIMPPFIDFVNREVHKDWERFIVTSLMCLGLAFMFKWREVAYGTPEDVFATATIIFAESQLIFKLYFKNSYVRLKMHEKLNITRAGSPLEALNTPEKQ